MAKSWQQEKNSLNASEIPVKGVMKDILKGGVTNEEN